MDSVQLPTLDPGSRRYKQLQDTPPLLSDQSDGMSMSANLVVIAFVRVIQVILAGVLFYKAFTLSINSSLDVFCPGQNPPPIRYQVAYPFDYIRITVRESCSLEDHDVTDEIATEFAGTSYLFTTIVVISIAYALGAIAFYAIKYHEYDADKRMPAFDLLASLVVAVIWAVTAYLAWNNYPSLKENSKPDSVQRSVRICNNSPGYCNSNGQDHWGDMNTYLFLAIANILSWGISVWFIFMETGIYPEDEEWLEAEYATMPPGSRPMSAAQMEAIGGMPPGTFTPFPQLNEKQQLNATGASGMYDQPLYESNGLGDDQLMEYIRNWRNQGNGEGDRFANGYTFSPIVPSISEAVESKGHRDSLSAPPLKAEKIKGQKWNLFQA